MQPPTREACEDAFRELASLARQLAPPHVAVAEVPEDPDEMWRQLQEWMSLPFRERGVMHVWSGGCQKTMYPSPADNHAFRAWHDSLHIAMGQGFDRSGERRVAIAHIRTARMHGCSRLAQSALVADTWGQFLYGEAHAGAFVEDQWAFVIACLQGRSAGVDYTRIGSAIEEVIASGEEF